MPRIIVLIILFTIITRQAEKSNVSSNNVANVDSIFNIECASKYFPNSYEVKTTSVDEATVYDSKGNNIGYLLSTHPIADNIIGYAGKVPVVIAVDNKEVILGVNLLENNESRGFIKRITKRGFFSSWNNMSVKEALTADIDVISGASMTTGAIKSGVQLRLSKYLESTKIAKAIDWTLWIAYGASILIIIFALLSFIYPKSFAGKRIVLLVASICVLGFWRGEFISLALMYGWLINGIPISTKFIMLGIVLLSVLLPLFTNRAFYCTYVCPYGAAQELMGKITRNKIKLSQNIIKYLNYLKMIIFYGLILLIILRYSIDLSDVEPFSAFLISVASPSAIIIASLFLIVSIFIPKAWCRFFCPTGYLLEIFRKGNL